MKRTHIVALTVLFFAGLQVQGLHAETPRTTEGPAEPAQPDIILPTEVFELDAFTVETVTAPLPHMSEIRIPVLPVPLPESGQLQVTEAALAIDPTVPAGATVPPPQAASSVFSTARVGVGSRNWLFGDLSVFALGTEPRFSFEFQHESLDGFGQENAGTGFFSGTDRIASGLEFSAERTDVNASLSFDSRRYGLQGQGPFLSLDQRFTRTEVDVLRQTDGPFSFGGRLALDYAERVFTDPEEPESEQSLDTSVSGRAVFGFDRLDLSFTGQYGQSWDNGGLSAQSVSGGVGLDLAFDNGLIIDGELGVAWRPESGFRVPFEVGVGGAVTDRLSLDFRTGQSLQDVSRTILWDSVLAMESPPENIWTSEWFGSIEAIWFAGSATTISGSGRFSYAQDTYDIGPFDPDSGRHELVLVDTQTSIQSQLRASYNPRPQFRGALELDLRLLDSRSIHPNVSLGLESEFLTRDGLSGIVVRADTPVFIEESQEVSLVLPELGITGQYSVTDTIQVFVGVRDVLDLLDTGAPRFLYRTGESGFPLIQPGFRATISAQLSL